MWRQSESFGEIVGAHIGGFVAAHLMWFVYLVLIGYVALNIYKQWFEIKRNENIDLVGRYINLQLRRRYKL